MVTELGKRASLGWLSDEESACHCRKPQVDPDQEDPTCHGTAKPMCTTNYTEPVL